LARRCKASQRPGNVINVSSISSSIVNVPQHQAIYNASKAAVGMLTKCLAIEWIDIRVRVNAIAPGYFASEMTRAFIDRNPEIAARWESRIPLGRMGQPDELGGLVVYLASDASRYMLGQTVVVDGGYTIV
jgi:NAD(P)-dependent dehydrogenase (short-subunit alcohol dehydrogenase family)